MNKAYFFGTCLLLWAASDSSGSISINNEFDHSQLRTFEKTLSDIKIVDEFLDPYPHGDAGFM